MRLLLILYIAFFLAKPAHGQSVAPFVVNTSGGIASIPDVNGSLVVYYNIGETIIDDVANSNETSRLTQGFLQPDIIGNGILTVYSFTTAMTCYSSNDASAVLNTSGLNSPFRYTWFKNGILLSDTGSTLLNLGAGTYSFVVKDKKGNLRTGQWDVLNGSGPCRLIIHNGLSPNGDGHNDFFYVEHIEDYRGNRISIFNRWGDLVWDGKDYDNYTTRWKGEDRHGDNLSAGTYYYIIEIDGKKTTGWVELMR